MIEDGKIFLSASAYCMFSKITDINIRSILIALNNILYTSWWDIVNMNTIRTNVTVVNIDKYIMRQKRSMFNMLLIQYKAINIY